MHYYFLYMSIYLNAIKGEHELRVMRDVYEVKLMCVRAICFQEKGVAWMKASEITEKEGETQRMRECQS